MRLQCGCGFVSLFVGGGTRPTKCPVCKTGVLSAPVATQPCPHCSLAYPVASDACPGCGVEKISRQRSKENGSAPKPDDPPRRS